MLRPPDTRHRRLLAVALSLAVIVACSPIADDAADQSKVTPAPTETAAPATSPPTTHDTTATDDPTTDDPAPADEPSDDVLDPGAGAITLDDPYVGTYGNGGYDVLSYDLSIDWEPSTSFLDGLTVIEATATQDLTRFNLDLYALVVDGVTVNDIDAEFSQDDAELTIVPATELSDGETFTVAIDYSGTPQDAGGPLGSENPSGWKILEDSIYVIGEPVAAATFHPANDHPSDKASFTYRLTALNDLDAIAVGTLTSSTDNGDGTTTWVYDQPFPQTTYLTTVLIGPYEVREATPSSSGVPIRNVFHRSLADEVEPVFELQDEMMDAFEPLFGPYPFDVYGSAVVDDDLGAALETQTLSIYGRDIAGFGGFAEAVVAHELAHQWFGNAVSLERWEDLWLNEGFASYAEALWEEAKDPTFDYQDWIRNQATISFLLEGQVQAPPTNDLFGLPVYLRGALTLHALRLEIGDDDFFELLQTWVVTYSGGNATTADFEAMAEDISGVDLEELFDLWLRTEDLPAELDGIPLRP